MILQTPQALYERFALDVRVHHEVIDVDATAHRVTVRNLLTQQSWEEPYDQLILSTGAASITPGIPGVEHAFTLRDVSDLDRLLHAARQADRAVVIGGGFIGLEMAENLQRRGIACTVIEAAPQLMTALDPEMAVRVEAELARHGVEVLTSTKVVEIGEGHVALGSGRQLSADLVVLATGVRPESMLAQLAGLKVSSQGAIVVDAQQRTSDRSIYAVGDVTVKHGVRDSELLAPLANTANRQGRLVADAVVGRAGKLRPTLGTAILGVFDLTVALTGETELRALDRGITPRVIHIHPVDHAGYYPGAQSMTLKLVVDPDSDAILGAQGVGGRGVDKRIDIIATAMFAGLTASELADLELAYAPQFGSAKDPINMLGFVAENLRDQLTASLQWHELDAALANGAQLIDVRTADEVANGMIPQSDHLDLAALRDRMDELPEGELIVYCAVGQRGYTAARILTHHGRQVRNLDGGYKTWRDGQALRRTNNEADRRSAADETIADGSCLTRPAGLPPWAANEAR